MLNSKLVARFLVLTLMVSACSKDKETEPSYPITFVGHQYSVKSETRVFTSEGEQPLTEEYKSLLATQSFFDLTDWVGKGKPYLTLQTNGTAVFTENPAITYTYKRTDNDWLFTAENTFILPDYSPIPALPQIYVHNDEFQAVPAPGGFQIRFKAFRMAEGTLQTIRIPITVMLIARISEYESSVGASRLAKKLKNDFVAELLQTVPATDIVMIKEFELVCKAETK